jgi:hypothetical protein
MTYRVVNAKDFFNCSWTTITAPASTATNFKCNNYSKFILFCSNRNHIVDVLIFHHISGCRDEQASAGNGAISTIQEINTNDDWYRVCPFFINSTAGRLTQMSCSAVSAKSLLPLTTVRQFISIIDLFINQI